jgi:hypothetical protein
LSQRLSLKQEKAGSQIVLKQWLPACPVAEKISFSALLT